MSTREINKIPKKKNIIIQALKIIDIIFITIAILFSAVVLLQRINSNLSFFGYRIYKVETGSMVPVYNVGDVILAKETAFSKINVDDDIVYLSKAKENYGYTITHRVIEKDDENGTIITKGVANNIADQAISEDQIIGVVKCKLTIITWICKFLNNYIFVYFFVVIPGTVYFFFAWLHKKNLQER